MKNKYKNIIIVFVISLFLGLAGCSTINNSKTEKITNNEYSSLVAYARTTLCNMPERKISYTEKQYIKYNKPEFDVKYESYKSGDYTLTWDINNKKIVKYIGNGDLAVPKSSFRKISIVTIHINSDK
jgi:hypothetical protein